MIKSAHQFKAVYDRRGIDLSKLGCVMLDVHSEDLKLGKPTEMLAEQLYTSPNPDRFWIKGFVAHDSAHVTLLYGLIEHATLIEEDIKAVLEGWSLDTVTIEDIGHFESPYPDEPYYCIVAHIQVTPELMEGHQRLEMLPHINTFPGYKAHLTLMYIKKDEVFLQQAIAGLRNILVGKKIGIKQELNLGKLK